MFLKTSVGNKQWNILALIFALSLVVAPIAACAGAPDAADGGPMANAADNEGGDAGDEAGGEHAEEGEGHEAGEGEGEGGGEHVHPAGDDIPTRADESDRDEYSKPHEVYEFAGIGEGDVVVDIGAGSGYNTYLLSGVVGASGHVYAERGNEGLAARIAEGDLHEGGNITMVDSRGGVPEGSADAVVLIREYHLVEDYLSLMSDLDRMLKPDGVLVVVEVRSNEAEGHNMETHRLGEQTVVEQFGEGGFTLDSQSEILRRDDDDYSIYGSPLGPRYTTDRMLMTFRKTQQ